MRNNRHKAGKQGSPWLIRYADDMLIPHRSLTAATLRAVVEEFVTRDGTDHSYVQRRVEVVLRQLDSGQVALHFDDETATCNILPVTT